jgi:hypothetical protein
MNPWNKPFVPGIYKSVTPRFTQQAIERNQFQHFQPLFQAAGVYRDNPTRFGFEFPKMRDVDEFTRFALSPALSNQN